VELSKRLVSREGSIAEVWLWIMFAYSH
jgi:hypothetical protein